MNRVKIHAIVLAATLLLPAVAAAGRPDDMQQTARGRGAAERDALAPAQVLNMLDAWAIVQAQDALQLADDQYGEFVSRLKRLQQTRRRNLQGRNAILVELRRLTAPQAPPADDGVIRERLRVLADHDDRAAADMRKAYEELDQVLTPRQQARFRLFEEALERRKIDLLQRAQRAAADRQRRQ